MFGSGIDQMGCLVDAAVEQSVIVRKGSWYSWKNENFAQGRQRACAFLALEENKEMKDEIEEMLRQSLIQDIVDGTIVDTEMEGDGDAAGPAQGLDLSVDNEIGILE